MVACTLGTVHTLLVHVQPEAPRLEQPAQPYKLTVNPEPIAESERHLF